MPHITKSKLTDKQRCHALEKELKQLREELMLLQKNKAEWGQQIEKLTNENKKIKQYSREDKQVVENINESIMLVDTNGHIQAVNPAFSRITGYSQKEAIGKNPRILKSGRHKYTFYQKMWDDIIDSGSWHGEIWNRRKNGDIYPELLSINSIKDWNGEVVNYVGIFSDISQVKQMEHKLELLSQAMEHSPAAVIITNIKGVIEYVNPRFCKVMGYKEEEVIGQKPSHFSAGESDQTLYKDLWKTISQGRDWHGEFLNKTKKGELVWQLTAISPVLDSNGNITHYVAVEEDITQRKELEQATWQQANHDYLTGLPNRNLWNDRFDIAISQADRENLEIALIYMDLDHFKMINDTFGHKAGDEVLREAARRYQRCIRASDTLARQSGDEYTILLMGKDCRRMAENVAKKILHCINQPFTYNNQSIELSVSIGIALYPEYRSKPEELIMHADQAMYRAKNKGKNQYSF